MSADVANTEPLWEKCPKCAAHYYSSAPQLIHAFASVGIEHGKSTWQMAESYFEQFHKNKHRKVGA